MKSSLGVWILLAITIASPCAAGQGTSQVAATVDGAPIHVKEVTQELQRIVGKRKLRKDVYLKLQKAMVKRLVDKRLILRYLASKRLGASKQQIESSIDRLKKQLEAKKQTLDEFLQKKKLTTDELRLSFAWEIGWTMFLNRYLTDENLEKYFKRNARDFDGTQLHVAHILIKAKAGDNQARQSAKAKLQKLRVQLVQKELDFATAAKKHSQSPSAKKGGDIGLIGRNQPMPNDFSKVAYALDVGEISKPVETAFGVHLIKCLAIKKGKKTWKEARPKLIQAINNYLYTWAADQQRPKATVKIADKFK